MSSLTTIMAIGLPGRGKSTMGNMLAGEAVFEAAGRPPRRLGPGDTAFHASNQPHAMTTEDKPVLAYVLWRGDLKTPPILTPENQQP